MNFKKLFPALLLTSAMLLSACGPKEVKIEQVTFEPNDLAAEVSDHTAADYVKSIGSYTGLTVNMPEPTISDSDVDAAMNQRRYDFAKRVPVTNGAVANTTLSVNYSVTVDGEEIEGDDSEAGYEFILGQAELGLESDKKLMGAVAGDHLEFEVTLTASHGKDLEGKTAEYVVDVLEVYNYELPKLDDAFLKENTDYKNMKEFEKAIRADLMKEAERSALSQAYKNALQQVTDASEVDGCPEKLYDELYEYYEDVYEYAASMFGVAREDYISSYALSKEVDNIAKNVLVMEAIANEEGLGLTEEDFDAYIETMLAEAGYDSVEDMGLNYNETIMRIEALRQKVGAFILNSAKVYEEKAE